MDEDGQPQLDLPGRLAFKRASPLFKTLLRSKGFVWLATRPKVSGEWSQSGVMYTLQGVSHIYPSLLLEIFKLTPMFSRFAGNSMALLRGRVILAYVQRP